MPEFPPKGDLTGEQNKREIKRARRNEARYVAMQFKVANCTKWNEYDIQTFILSAKWFGKWKNYVEYDELINGHKRTTPSIHSASTTNGGTNSLTSYQHPGPIANDHLLLDQKEYFRDFSCPNSICNTVISDCFEENKDYYVISKQMWQYLHNKYGGMTIARNSIPVGPNGLRKVDLKFTRVILISSSHIGKDSVYKERKNIV